MGQLVAKRADFNLGLLSSEVIFCEYKGFEELALTLIGLKRSCGGQLQSSWALFLQALREELRFQKKVEKWRNEGIGQFLLMNLFIWLFISLFHYQLNIPFAALRLVHGAIFLWQSLGLFLFIFLFFRSLNRLTLEGGEIAQFLVCLESLYQSPLSISEVVERSGWSGLQVRNKEWRDLKDMADLGIDTWRKTGQGIAPLIHDLKEEFRFIFESQSQQLQKQLKIMQVAISALFVLPCFFVFTLSALASLLAL